MNILSVMDLCITDFRDNGQQWIYAIQKFYINKPILHKKVMAPMFQTHDKEAVCVCEGRVCAGEPGFPHVPGSSPGRPSLPDGAQGSQSKTVKLFRKQRIGITLEMTSNVVCSDQRGKTL